MWLSWFLMAIIVWEVLIRNFLNRPTIWAHELSVMLFGALTILSGGYTLKEKGHVNMDLLYSSLSGRWKTIMDIIAFPFLLIFAVVLMWLGWGFAMDSFNTNEVSITPWAPLIWPVKFLVPLGALLLLLQGTAKLVADVLTLIGGKGGAE
jgi:TRAP-type mannitol/chloroaromatic compound transport system permease small subunit